MLDRDPEAPDFAKVDAKRLRDAVLKRARQIVVEHAPRWLIGVSITGVLSILGAVLVLPLAVGIACAAAIAALVLATYYERRQKYRARTALQWGRDSGAPT